MLAELTEITRAGGQLALKMKQEPQHINQKDGSNWNIATQADALVEELIIHSLQEAFPAIPVIGEEQDEHHIPGGTFFTVDPVDGTIPFSHGFSNWGAMIGYIEGGQPVAGVIFLPELAILIRAQKGTGCYVNDQLVRLSYSRPLAESVVEAEIGPWVPAEQWVKLSALRTKCRWLGGSGFAAASVADILCGKAGAYPNFNGKIWDFSASAIAITEAGGIACQVDGQPLRWDSINMQALFAANDHLAGEILTVIAES